MSENHRLTPSLSVDMGPDGFNFGTEHSAEWVYGMQRAYPFWREVLKQFDINGSLP